MFKAIIIDDERHCRETMEELLRDINIINLVGQAENIKEGLKLIIEEQPDIIFLDIEMPDGTGFNLLEQFQNPKFQVIFTTGHNDFAIKAFKHSAIDYLLKPIEKEELIPAIDRAVEQINIANKGEKIEFMLSSLEQNKFTKLALPSADGIEFVEKNDIIFCEADGSYTQIHLINDKKILSSYNLKKIGDLLSDKHFFRVHKSFVISLQHIEKVNHSEGGVVVMSNTHSIPIARRRKDEFLKFIGL